MPHKPKELYEFSKFRLDVFERVLSREGKRVTLADKAFDTLCVLVRNQGRLVGKDELLSAVWPDSVVEENNLDQKISALRGVLGGKGKSKEKFIETVRGHGYRFLPAVRRIDEASQNSANMPAGDSEVSAIRAIPGGQVSPENRTKSNVVAVAKWRDRDARVRSTSDVRFEEPAYLKAVGDPPGKSAPEKLSKTLGTKLIVGAIAVFLAVSALALWHKWGGPNRPANGPIDSIAILPFVNETDDPGVEYISDGITEGLINNLAEVQQLRVVARTTAFRYKGREIDPRSVGRELGVRAVLMGRVLQTGDTLDVQVDLIYTSDGTQIWGSTYHRRASDILAVKQAIVQEAARSLKLELTGGQSQDLNRPETTSSAAYESYLRGRYFWNQRTEDSIKKALGHFERTIAIDPNYALGHVGMADSYIFLVEFGSMPASEAMPRARMAVDRALQIDGSLAEAYASSALIHRLEWRWAEAEQDFQRAINLNPNYSTARVWYSILFRNKRQFDAAFAEVKRAEELDPLSTTVGANVAYVHILRQDLESAIKQCNKVLELDPNAAVIHELIGVAYLRQERFNDATAAIGRAVEITKGKNSRFLSSLGYAHAVAGHRREALDIVQKLNERYSEGEANGQNLAAVYVGLGELDKAFALLESDFKEKRILLPEITWRYAFDGIREHPRYQSLVRRMGLSS